MQIEDIFQRLRNGETILPNDPQAYKMREVPNKTYCFISCYIHISARWSNP